jgi:hypothetical protein
MGDVTGDFVPDCIAGSGFSTNRVFCLNGATGDTLWTKGTASAVESGWPMPSIDANGYDDVLAGTRDGMIYAISGGEPEVGVSIDGNGASRGRFRLLGAYPNPFCSDMVILLAGLLPGEDSGVDIYDVSGRQVTSLANPDEPGRGGLARFVWTGTDRNGWDVPSGVYFCKARSGQDQLTIKVLRLR